MNATDKALAEAVIRRLCVGAQVAGIGFGPSLQLLLSDQPPIRGQVYLNLESTWTVYAERPAAFPPAGGELLEYSEEEAIRRLCDLREAVIRDAELAEDAPDLILTFEDGRVFFLNGRDDAYETWQLGVAFARDDPPWLVVACPGGEVAVWAPRSFDECARGS